MSEEAPLTRSEILTNVQRLCRSFALNMAYYRAGWRNELGPLLKASASSATGNFWIVANNNFFDMCVLDWCKLFGGQTGYYSWKQVVPDSDDFKTELLQHLGLDEDAFKKEVRRFREYRDQWVAHLDLKRKGHLPRLDIARKAVWFYYERTVAEHLDQEMGPKTIETGYQECELEADLAYRRALQTQRP